MHLLRILISPKCNHRLIRNSIHIRKVSNINATNNSNNNTKDIPISGDRLMYGTLIYSAPKSMVKMIKAVKAFSISTTLITGGLQPFVYQQFLSSSSAIALVSLTAFASVIVLSPLLLNWITKRYVIHIYYDKNSDTFTAITLNLLNMKSKTSYKANEVLIPEVLGILTSYTVGKNKRPFFTDINSVIDFNYYRKMLGYKKPSDIKFKQLYTENTKQS